MPKTKKLVIVESPTKAKTINKFLGSDYKVVSSYGHVRDLPRGSVGVDTENNYEPKYVVPTKARKKVNELKKEIEKIDELIIASDEDREGEAIAWHIIKAFGLDGEPAHSKRLKIEDKKKISRIAFHEITKEAIEEALKNPRDLKFNLVNAQQARRILDRLVGYKLSPFLWKKIANHLSAGRVQSVALRLIVDRENEIKEFKPDKYWTIESLFEEKNIEFDASLLKINGESFPKPGIMEKSKALEIVKEIENSELIVDKLEKKEKQRSPKPPFTTSTLQQEASKRLYFSAKQTMMYAQKLYEKGLITYMRTDSVNLSKSALAMAKTFIQKEFGDKYLIEKPRQFKTKSKMAQEAHEAIRPTSLEVNKKLEEKELKLFNLIKERFLASQMPPAIFVETKLDIKNKSGLNKYILRANGQILKFDGYIKVWKQKYEEKEIPNLEKGNLVDLKKIEASEHETTPPPRYNEASLVKLLEEKGIGRPSTYASIISVIKYRNYVEMDSSRRFHATEMGELVTKLLKDHFPNIVDTNFTAKMEEDLDSVAEGNKDWHSLIKNFYKPFEKTLEEKYEEVSKEETVGKIEETDEKCEKCGKPMAIKQSRFGKFLACTGFPECRNTKSLESENNAFGKCPECGKGIIVKKRTRKGRFFFGCDRYPDCEFAKWNEKDLEKAREEKDSK
jgi:DNA topoisomerase-1